LQSFRVAEHRRYRPQFIEQKVGSRKNGGDDAAGCVLLGELLFARRGANRGHFVRTSKPLTTLGSMKTLMQSNNVARAITGWMKKLQPVAIRSRRQTREWTAELIGLSRLARPS